MYDVGDVVALSRHGRMSSTYKPALLKAITRIVARAPRHRIAVSEVGDEFALLYWNQTIVFHLRQAASVSKEPEVIGEIRQTSLRCGVTKFPDLPEIERAALGRKMARILPLDVLPRFHNSKPPHMPPLFDWHVETNMLVFTDAALTFISRNAATIITVANLWWASYLEKVNILAPSIIDKVQRDGARRASLQKYLAILIQVDDAICFYCGRLPSSSASFQVDHVLPWTFILADPLWDLVLACARCNGAKSDRLPQRAFVEKLELVNIRRAARSVAVYGGPPPLQAGGVLQLFDAAIAVEWPSGWAPL